MPVIPRRIVLKALASAGAAALAPACRVEIGTPEARRDGAGGGEVWVYTSMYPEVIAGLDELVAARLPELVVRWYQGGSEKVAQRLAAEWAAGGSPCDLVLTSDPFWYEQARRDGRLRRHVSREALRIPRDYLDLDGHWATARLSLMVLAVHGGKVPEPDRPRSFLDLADPRFKDRASTGDPLASGTTLTLLAFLHRKYGWDYYRALRANRLVAAGGNSAVLQRIESGERPVGALLLENLLAARAHATPAVPVLPDDGAIVVPGPIAMLAGSRNPEGAARVYDLVLSPEGQAEIARGHMYPAREGAAAPAGAPALGTFPVQPWSEDFIRGVVDGRAELIAGYERALSGA